MKSGRDIVDGFIDMMNANIHRSGREESQGTVYNVSKDLSEWAKTKVSLWTEAQKDAIRKEFTRIDREFHGQRVEARRISNQRV